MAEDLIDLEALEKAAKEVTPGLEWFGQMDRYELIGTPPGSNFINEQVILALCATGDHAGRLTSYLAKTQPATILRLIEERRALLAGLREFLDAAPQPPKALQWLADVRPEDLFDAGLRHKNGKGPVAYLRTWLSMFRPFAFATKDDSWGELEKLICIVMGRYVRMIRVAEKARATIAKMEGQAHA